jgi:hypothetical protein
MDFMANSPEEVRCESLRARQLFQEKPFCKLGSPLRAVVKQGLSYEKPRSSARVHRRAKSFSISASFSST